MYITHLAALGLSSSFQCRQRTHPATFKSPRDTRGYDTDTHRNTCIGSARLERRLGAEEARVGMKTVMTAAHSSTQQHTACQPTCSTCLITTCPGPAHVTRLDPVCARDSFGALPHALARGRARISRVAVLLVCACASRALSPSLSVYRYTIGVA